MPQLPADNTLQSVSMQSLVAVTGRGHWSLVAGLWSLIQWLQ